MKCSSKKRKSLLYWGLNLCLSQVCLSQDLPNLQLVTNLTDSLLEVGLNEVLKDNPTQVALKGINDKGLNWFLEDRLIEALKEHHVSPIVVYDSRESGEVTTSLSDWIFFEYQMTKLSLQSEDLGNEGTDLSRIRRTSQVEFFLNVRSGDSDNSIYQRKLQGTRTSVVESEETMVEESSRDDKHQKKIIQPVVISAVSAVVVYLFYALRSR